MQGNTVLKFVVLMDLFIESFLFWLHTLLTTRNNVLSLVAWRIDACVA